MMIHQGHRRQAAERSRREACCKCMAGHLGKATRNTHAYDSSFMGSIKVPVEVWLCRQVSRTYSSHICRCRVSRHGDVAGKRASL